MTSASVCQTGSPPRRAVRWLNMLAPGCGLVWLGDTAAGLAAWATFLVGANLAVAGALILPADIPLPWRGIGLGAALGAFWAAQWRLAQHLRGGDADAHAATRRAGLLAHREALARGDAGAARAALEPIAHLAAVDLTVAVRLAQTLAANGLDAEARMAWQRVRRLDRHRIYPGGANDAAAESSDPAPTRRTTPDPAPR